MRPLPTKTSYTDNLLVFYSILASRQIALMPRHVFVYQYKFGYLDQSMLPNNMLSSLPKLINIFHQMLNFNDKDLTNKRIRSLINCIKQMFYLIMLIISLNKQIYHWQKKQQINAELTFLRKNCEMHNSYYNKLIKTGYLFFINKHTLPLIMKLNKLILITSQIGFLKLLKGQYKKYQREKV
jgi:hypothetical protein